MSHSLEVQYILCFMLEQLMSEKLISSQKQVKIVFLKNVNKE